MLCYSFFTTLIQAPFKSSKTLASSTTSLIGTNVNKATIVLESLTWRQTSIYSCCCCW